MSDQTPLVRWLFMDMDGFFAAVEEHLRPELRGRVVGIVPVEARGTCVIASNAQAKRLGIKVGTPVREALARRPDIALVKARPAVYVRIHHDILRSVDRCAPVHKVYSIDEWAIRLGADDRRSERARALSLEIKRRLLEDFSPWLTCSIGLAGSRLLAKIGSDLDKPDGLVTLLDDDLPGRLAGLELDDLPGIAGGVLGRLHRAGVRTIGELWAISRHDARRIWGSVQGEAWWAGFHGIDEPEPRTRRRMITHAHMLAPEFRDDAGARGILLRLLCKAATRLRIYRCFAHRLHIAVRSYSGRGWEAESILPGVDDTLTFVRQFAALWAGRPWAQSEEQGAWRPFAKVAVTLSGLTPEASTPGALFAQERDLRRLSGAIDELHRRIGQHAVYMGSLHGFRHEMEDKIAFGRIPDPTRPHP